MYDDLGFEVSRIVVHVRLHCDRGLLCQVTRKLGDNGVHDLHEPRLDGLLKVGSDAVLDDLRDLFG